MKTYARMEDGLAVELIEPLLDENGQEVPIAERFHPDFLDTLVEYDPTTPPVQPQEPTLEALQAMWTAAATAKRWEVETSGITLPGGIKIGTDKDDQARVTSVVGVIGLTELTTVKFKAASGWVDMSIDQVRAVAKAIALHVQACFNAEYAHHETIAALATLEAAQGYDVDAGWPE